MNWQVSRSRLAQTKEQRRSRLLRRIWSARELYLLLLPTIIYFLVFHYYPYLGLSLAFKDFSPAAGIWGSPWVGLENFRYLFSQQDFYQVLLNTIVLSISKLVIGFPFPIIFALLLNEVRIAFFKRTVQTVSYFPHFLSWVVYGGIMLMLLAPNGVVARLLAGVGLDGSRLLSSPQYFPALLIATDILKNFGWNAIVYLAAITAIDPTLYEAARVDGANRWQQVRYITLPALRATMVLVFVLSLGSILDAGFEQIFVMYNPSVYDVADIIDTYVYRIGIVQGEYDLATAIGLFKGVIGFVLIVTANRLIKRSGEPTLW
jgi:putative aldouronate transport system permease protein